MKNNLKNQLKLHKEHSRDRVFNLKQHTCARIGLGHTGGHLQTKHWLELQANFAQAKDAVHSQFDMNLITTLSETLNLNSVCIQSRAEDNQQFLLRPDLGSFLSVKSENDLKEYIHQYPDSCNTDLLIIISGGLSPHAVQKQIPDFFLCFMQKIKQEEWSIAPVLINPHGRVALGDHANYFFKAKITIVLIGERPGLSTTDSMGIYMTYNANLSCTNDQRNCISNIHQYGLTHDEAALKLFQLIKKSLALKLTGVDLKDDLIIP